jgi:hypothetical protein
MVPSGEPRSGTYRAATRQLAEAADHTEASRAADEGYVPTAETWSEALGQQVLGEYASANPTTIQLTPAIIAAVLGPGLAGVVVVSAARCDREGAGEGGRPASSVAAARARLTSAVCSGEYSSRAIVLAHLGGIHDEHSRPAVPLFGVSEPCESRLEPLFQLS